MRDPGQPSVEHSEEANDLADKFARFLAKMQRAVKKIIKAFKKLVDNVRHWWTSFDISASYLINRALNAIAEGIRKATEYVRQFLKRSTPMISLILASFDWLSRVKQPVSELQNQIKSSEQATENIEKWKSDASDAYNMRKGEQLAALGEIKTDADVVSEWLDNVAKSNVSFAGKLASHLGKLAVRLLATAGEAESVVGIPLALQQANDVVNETVEMVGTALEGTVDMFMEAISGMRDLASVESDHEIFGGGKWPQAVTA